MKVVMMVVQYIIYNIYIYIYVLYIIKKEIYTRINEFTRSYYQLSQ